MIAHTCPKCNGETKIPTVSGEIVADRDCPTCSATGVVWQTTLSDVTQMGRRNVSTGVEREIVLKKG